MIKNFYNIIKKIYESKIFNVFYRIYDKFKISKSKIIKLSINTILNFKTLSTNLLFIQINSK